MDLHQHINAISADELRSMLEERNPDSLVLVDVRTPAEYRQGHLPGALHLPLGDLQQALDRDEKPFESTKDHVFYCKSGSRSHRAALLAMAGDMVSGQVLNLDGGMMSWEGMALPDTPRVDLLIDQDRPENVLLRAMEMERGAMLFYEILGQRVQDPDLKDMMLRLTDMELGHARVVYSRLRRLDPEVPPFETLFAPMRGDILEGGRSVDELAPWVDSALEGSGLELMELALEIEYNALDLYTVLAHANADEPEIQAVYLDLARQEKNHVRIILDRLDDFA